MPPKVKEPKPAKAKTVEVKEKGKGKKVEKTVTKAVKEKTPKEKVERAYDPLKGERTPLLKALYKLKALGETDAVDADKVAEKAGMTKEKVKHYFYKDGDLVMKGFVGISQGTGRSLEYYLTSSGVSLVSG